MEAIMTMILHYLKAMMLPCLVALPFVLLFRWLYYRKTNEWHPKREAVMVIFILYLVAVLSQTIIPESFWQFGFSFNPWHIPNSQNTILFLRPPFGWIQWMITLHNIAEIVRNIGGNIVLFIPYGIFFPYLFKKQQKFTVLFGMLFSLFIEISQLFTDRVTDLNDIILNTLGIGIGYLIYWILYAIIKKRNAVHYKMGEKL